MSGGGSIDAGTGLYTAPGAAANVTVRVTDSANRTAQATVTVLGPLALSPSQVTVGASTSTDFVATGGRTPYTFSIVAGGGTLNSIGVAGGRYTAPATIGSATVRVTDAANVSRQATITINPPLAMSPASITMTAASGQSYPFAARDGVPPYTYQVTGPGSIDANGLYTAGIGAGPATVQVRDAQGTLVPAAVESIWIRTNGPVRAAVNDGANWYVGGDFTSLHPYEAANAIVLDAASGAPILACDLKTGFDGRVRAIARSGTHLFVGGDFTTYQGTAARYLAKIDAATCALDTTFTQAVSTDAPIGTLAIAGSALYVGGEFTTYRGSAANYLAKVNADTGALDATFTQDTGPNFHVRTVAVGGGAVFIGGLFGSYRGQPAEALAKVDAITGALDTTFTQSPGIFGTVSSLVVDGVSLYVGGQVLGYRGAQVRYLLKLDVTSGDLDTTFTQTAGLNSEPSSVAVSAASVYAGGLFSDYRGTPVTNLVKLDKLTGALDASFSAAARPNATVWALAVSGNNLYLGGAFDSYAGSPARELAKVDATTGALDTNFTRSTGFDQTVFIATREVRALSVLGSSLVVGGNFRTYRGTPANRVAKFDMATGMPDATFNQGAGADNIVFALARSGTSLYIGGVFTSYRDEAYRYLVKVNTGTGTVDTIFNQPVGFSGDVVVALQLAGSSLYVGGSFTSYRGGGGRNIAKLNASSGDLDSVFQVGFDSIVQTIQVSGNALYAGGAFFPSLAKVDAGTGAADPAWAGRNTSHFVLEMLSAGPALYIGGSFEVYSGTQQAWALAKVNAADAVLDTAFTQPNGFRGGGAFGSGGAVVDALALSGNALFAAGLFTSYRGTPVGSIAKLDTATGNLDTVFSQAQGLNGIARFLLPTATAVWVGGEFTSYRGRRGYYFIPVDPVTGVQLEN